MADTTVKIEVDGSAAISTLKQLTQANREFEASAQATVNATNESGKGLDEMGRKAAGARGHLIQLIQDLAEGRNAFRSFSAQGVDLLKNTDALKALAASAMTPTGALVALGVVVAGTVYEIAKGSSELSKLRNSLTLTGNFAGMTAGEIDGMAKSMVGGSVTIGDMHGVLNSLAGSGRFTGEAFTETAKAIKTFSNLSGESADKVEKEFVKSLTHGIGGVKEMNEQLHYLSAAQFIHIDNLFKQGKTQDAIAENMKAFNAKLGEQTVQVGYLGRAWNAAAQGISNFFDYLKDIGKVDVKKSVDEELNQIKRLDDQIAQIQNKPPERRTQTDVLLLNELNKQKLDLQKKFNVDNAKLESDAAKSRADAQKAEAEDLKIKTYEANKGLSFGVALEAQRVEFAKRKMAIDEQAARQGESQVTVARAQLAYEEKLAALEAERGRLNQLDPLKSANTNARIDAARKIAQTERDDAIAIARIKDENAEKEFKEELRLRAEKLKTGRDEIDQGIIVQKQKENDAQLDQIRARRLKEIGDPGGTSDRGKSITLAIEEQKKLNGEIIRGTELAKLSQDITTKLHNKLTQDTATEIEKLKDQRAETLASTNLEVTLIKEKIRLRDEEKAKIVAIQDAIGDQSRLTQQQIDDQKKLTDAVKAEYDKRRSDAENAIRADEQITRTKEFGLEASFARISKMALTPAGIVSSVIDVMFNDMSAALNKFVDTGKLNFGNFAESVVKDLLKIALHESEVALFKAAGGASGIGAGLLSFFGGFFADGGSPPMGKASIVGENGPELFIPRTPGTIIPNNMLGGGGSVQNNVYHNYQISAIDAKSVAQLFYENRMTMYGVTEKARRELPMRTR